MSKIEVHECDKCKTLMKPDQGFVFIGNVHVIEGGGIIGNNFNQRNEVIKHVSIVLLN